MGWAGGTYVARPVVQAAKKYISDKKKRAAFYVAFNKAMEDADWDTQNEAEGIDPVFDAVLRKMHPEWYEDAE